ncbi:tRNA (guanosine(37)-N1)-methyltransferase TrmD [bacterium]|nr:tRNA (guanosine(37)-N1)-methyltransferase TrmD [bacterium]
MRFDVLTIFPEFYESPLRASILGRALDAGQVSCHVHNIRDWATGKHQCTDDTPYGGGGGMVMLAEPLLKSIRAVRAEAEHALGQRPPLVYLSPQGRPLDRDLVAELAALPGMLLLCAAYEGIDERVVELEIDREVSIGDYVLTSGDPAALVLLNAVARRIEGVLGNPGSAPADSFEDGLLDFPHYTRPETIEGLSVPPVLLSGHHANVAVWRRRQQLERTAKRRPDLLLRAPLTDADRRWLKQHNLWPGNADLPIGKKPNPGSSVPESEDAPPC